MSNLYLYISRVVSGWLAFYGWFLLSFQLEKIAILSRLSLLSLTAELACGISLFAAGLIYGFLSSALRLRLVSLKRLIRYTVLSPFACMITVILIAFTGFIWAIPFYDSYHPNISETGNKLFIWAVLVPGIIFGPLLHKLEVLVSRRLGSQTP